MTIGRIELDPVNAQDVLARTAEQVLTDSMIEALQAGDLEALLAQYHGDAVLVRLGEKFEGKAALCQLFAGLFSSFRVFRLVETEKFVEARDTIFFEAMVLGASGAMRVYSTFVLREGKIAHHFVGRLG